MTSDEQILDTARTFYEQLYRDDPVDQDIQDHFISQLDRRLDKRTKSTCGRPVTKEELMAAVKRKRMHRNKSPGQDGLTTEFYQTFWAELADNMVGTIVQHKPLKRGNEQLTTPITSTTTV